MSIKETKDAIESLRGMTASRLDGEWRVTFKLSRLLEMHPGNNRAWYEAKQEETAYYTSDSDDALATAKRMFEESVVEKVATKKTLIFDEPSSVDCHAMTDYCFRIRAEHNAEVEENTNYLKVEISSDDLIQFKNRITKKFGVFPFSESEHNNVVEGVNAMSAVNISIYETGNAAFADIGKQVEVARILRESAKNIRDTETYESVTLRDANGNQVGAIHIGGQGNFSTDVHAEFEDPSDAEEVARLIDVVAEHVENGKTDFTLRDINGNKVGKGATIEWSADKALMNIDGEEGIDFKSELKSGNVYLADGIEEGPFRYVVPTEDFEVGYHQEQGDAWLVDARGVVAPGYEDTQVVRELDFAPLPKGHRDDLMAIHEGTLSFQDFERKYGEEEDLEP